MTQPSTQTRTGSMEDPVARLRVEMAARWGAGDRVPAEELLVACPALSDEDALVVIMGELVLRWERGESPAVDEYLHRFPRQAADLPIHFELQAQLRAQGETIGTGPGGDQGTTSSHIPGYEILAELGRGGIAVVRKANS